MNIAGLLAERIHKLAPIIGVEIKTRSDKTTWSVRFLPHATQAEKDAAQAVIDTFDIAEEQKIEDAKKSLAESNKDLPEPLEHLYKLLIQKGTITEAEAEAASPGLTDKLTKRELDRAKIKNKK